MSAPRRVFAVVVNWNGGARMNLDCLHSLASEGIGPRSVVFVDNASEDGSLDEVKFQNPGLHVVENAENLGFAEGANQGLRRALQEGADAVFFINNDLTLDPGCLAQLVVFLGEHPEVGLCGPRVLDSADPRLLWAAGGELTWRQNLTTLRGHGKPDGPDYQDNIAVDFVPGCALLGSAAVLTQLGGFDPAFFAYMEDVDLCKRAKAEGYEIALVGEASARHAGSASTGGGYNPRRKYMMAVNSVWFVKRHGNAAAWARFLLYEVLSLPGTVLIQALRGNGRAARAKARGIFDGLRGRRVTAAAARRS